MPFALANVCAYRQTGCTAQRCVDNTGHPRVLAMFWAKDDRCHRVCLLRQPSFNQPTAAMCVRPCLGNVFVALWCLLCNELLSGYPHGYPSLSQSCITYVGTPLVMLEMPYKASTICLRQTLALKSLLVAHNGQVTGDLSLGKRL